MSETIPTVDWKKLMDTAGPYPLEAYNFVREGLNFAVHLIHQHPEHVPDDERHINGRQLCIGLRDFAIEQYGLLTPIVLDHWNIRRTEDFGRIVFAMVEAGLMSKTADDSLDDFRGVYDFHEAFCSDELLSRLGVNAN